ncbi:alpha/beta fold hydrolase [Paenibacillus sp. strain BS8-2]
MPHTYGSSSYLTLPDGRKLHYMSQGTGSPIVVFESGMGYSRSAWGLVQPRIAEQTQAVVYDRSGFGKSTPDTAPRTLGRMASDLGYLLDHLGQGPFILVGHSWGGQIVRAAAAANPSRIAALVLVDPSDEHFEQYFHPTTAKYFAFMRRILPFMARTGLYRSMSSKYGRVQPADVAADHVREDFTLQAARTSNAESLAFLDDLARVRARPPKLGSLPVTIISGTLITRAERKMRPAIMAAHQQTVDEHENGRWVQAPASGHMINFSEPGIIIEEIRLAVNQGETAIAVFGGAARFIPRILSSDKMQKLINSGV